jgi:GTP cyclohydrolase I
MNSNDSSAQTPHEIVTKLLPFLDKNPGREGLTETPMRYEKFLKEFFEEKPFKLTAFDSEGYDEMVIQTNIPFYSICEHHLVPFFGYGSIAYIPGTKIVGLSKLARTLVHFSRQLQNQERITSQTADFLYDALKPKGVAVSLTGRHLCMEMRGIEKPGTETTTTCLRGAFKTKADTRSEFLQFIRLNTPR